MSHLETPQRTCPFCEIQKDRIVAEYGTVLAFKDGYPVSSGHLLIVPKRHTPDFFTMTPQECRDAEDLLRLLKARMEQEDSSITGFNVGVNCGESAGQTIFHAHIHLIPRRDGDTPNPRGGVRGVIPEKMGY